MQNEQFQKLSKLVEILNQSGMPVALDHFEKAIDLPYIVYIVTGSDYEYADGIPFIEITHIQIELYTDNKDFEKESTVESLLVENELLFLKDEGFIEQGNDRWHMTTYAITM